MTFPPHQSDIPAENPKVDPLIAERTIYSQLLYISGRVSDAPQENTFRDWDEIKREPGSTPEIYCDGNKDWKQVLAKARQTYGRTSVIFKAGIIASRIQDKLGCSVTQDPRPIYIEEHHKTKKRETQRALYETGMRMIRIQGQLFRGVYEPLRNGGSLLLLDPNSPISQYIAKVTIASTKIASESLLYDPFDRYGVGYRCTRRNSFMVHDEAMKVPERSARRLIEALNTGGDLVAAMKQS
jgi:hypothetical protein